MNMQKLTKKTIEAIQAAQDTAIEYQNTNVDQPHLLYALMTQPAYRELAESLRLNADAQVLLISTEGDTSPDVYEDIVWFGRNG